jgi:hypothetical protein
MDNIKNSKFVANLKHQAEENPVVVMMATAALLTAVAKVIDAHGHNAGSRAYAKQINRKFK